MNETERTPIPLFLIHGNGVDHRILKPLEPVLGGFFECHFLDLPGFGNTEGLPGAAGLPELADWLEESIREMVGQGKFALAGNSLGGLLCQEIADRFSGQVQGMLLLAPVVFPNSADRTLPEAEVVVRDPALLETIPADKAELYAQVAVVQNRQTWQAFAQWVLPGIRAANLRAMAKLARRYYLDPLPVERDSSLEIPVSIVCGKHDQITGYEDQQLLLRRYPEAKLVVLEPAGHNLHLEQPEEVSHIVGAWVREVAQWNNLVCNEFE